MRTTYTKNHITTNVCKNEYNKVHKAVMNQEISDWIIEKFTQEKEIVLDPFLGIGASALACMNNNRKFIGIELDEKYFNIAKKRIEEE